MKKFLFDKPNQDDSDMTVFYGWQILTFIAGLVILVVIVINAMV
jgi:hypothetical protein